MQNSTVETLNRFKSMLASGPTGLGTQTTNIAALLNRPDEESDTELRHRAPYRNDVALGEELNDRLMEWAAGINLYEGHLDYLRKCNFGRYVMLTYAFTEDRERLFMAGQAMVSLFALDDYFVDDERAGTTHDKVGRNLGICMSALDEPYFTKKYNDDTDEGLSQHPVHIALREHIALTSKYATPQQEARVRHEDMCLFVAMCMESSWRANKMISPVWEYLGGRQMNGFTPCLTMIDIVDAYELPHNIYSMPSVRKVVKIAGLICVMVNDLVSTEKEAEAGMHQFGIREAIEKEEGCSYEEAHRIGVRFHNDLLRIFEDESAKLMVYATPELRRYLIGLEAWIAGSHLWHTTSERYSENSSDDSAEDTADETAEDNSNGTQEESITNASGNSSSSAPENTTANAPEDNSMGNSEDSPMDAPEEPSEDAQGTTFSSSPLESSAVPPVDSSSNNLGKTSTSLPTDKASNATDNISTDAPPVTLAGFLDKIYTGAPSFPSKGVTGAPSKISSKKPTV